MTSPWPSHCSLRATEETIHEDTTHFERERGRGVDGVDGRVCANAAIGEPVNADTHPVHSVVEPVHSEPIDAIVESGEPAAGNAGHARRLRHA